jgi:hypothetical protein
MARQRLSQFTPETKHMAETQRSGLLIMWVRTAHALPGWQVAE